MGRKRIVPLMTLVAFSLALALPLSQLPTASTRAARRF
jgi:hypothetical protein